MIIRKIILENDKEIDLKSSGFLFSIVIIFLYHFF